MPQLITWTDSFSVGVKAIDSQHRILIATINELHDAMSEGRGREVISKTYNTLLNYTVYHFGTEKNLMNFYGYFGDELRRHRNEHKAFLRTSVELQNQLDSGHTSLSIPTMDFLRDWWASHILGTDQALGKFLNSRGVD